MKQVASRTLKNLEYFKTISEIKEYIERDSALALDGAAEVSLIVVSTVQSDTQKAKGTFQVVFMEHDDENSIQECLDIIQATSFDSFGNRHLFFRLTVNISDVQMSTFQPGSKLTFGARRFAMFNTYPSAFYMKKIPFSVTKEEEKKSTKRKRDDIGSGSDDGKENEKQIKKENEM